MNPLREELMRKFSESKGVVFDPDREKLLLIGASHGKTFKRPEKPFASVAGSHELEKKTSPQPVDSHDDIESFYNLD